MCVCTVYFIPVFSPGKGRCKAHLSTSEDGTTEGQNTGVAPTVRGNWLCVCLVEGVCVCV